MPLPMPQPQPQRITTTSAAEKVGGAVIRDDGFLCSDCQFRGRAIDAIIIVILILVASMMIVAH